MAFRRRFAIRLVVRTVLLLGATAVTAWLAAWGRAPTAMVIAGSAVLIAAASIWHLVNESNADLARFVAALDRGDMTQAFARSGRGAGFDRLGAAYESALDRLRGEQARQAGASRFAEALVDGAPTPLLVIAADEEVTFANKAARRLFARSAPCPLADLDRFGAPFVAALRAAAPGPTRLARLTLDGLPQRVTLDTTVMDAAGARRRIVAIKSIQAELDSAELATQIDLVRVLTHEIMNSLTPVTSLATTAMRITAAIDPAAAPAIADAQLATAALARRAAELERFVESYKGFSEAPAIQREAIPVDAWLGEVIRLVRANPWAATAHVGLDFAANLPPLAGDRALLTQVFINLLKNAVEAAGEQPLPAVALTAAASADGRIKLTVTDNGPGIPAHLAHDVFLPFFTTKRTGTGIGLSFARQIVLLHDGQIGSCGNGFGCVEVVLPAYTTS